MHSTVKERRKGPRAGSVREPETLSLQTVEAGCRYTELCRIEGSGGMWEHIGSAERDPEDAIV